MKKTILATSIVIGVWAFLPLAAQAQDDPDARDEAGRDKGAERRRKLEALKEGNIHILVGTHAGFQKDVEFQDLR